MENDNSSNGRLTVKELRECKGFEDISDEEGEKLIDTLFQLSKIAYNVYVSDDILK